MTVGQLLVNMGINLAPLRTGAAQVVTILNNLRSAGVAAGQGLAQSFNFAGAQGGINALAASAGGLQRIIATIGAGRAVRELASLSDTAVLLSSRVRNVTASEEEFVTVNQKLFEIAQRTRTSLEGVVTIYTRLARSNDQIGASQEQLLRITETLNKTTIVYGNTTQEAQGALIQLSQAISSARLGGDELRTILEQLPPVAKAIAKEMGVTVGALRDLGRQGKITSQIVAQAILDMGQEIDDQFKKIPATIGQAFTQLENESLKTVENLNRITDAGPKTAGAIQSIVDAMEKVRDPSGPLLRGIQIAVEFKKVDIAFQHLQNLKDEAESLGNIKVALDAKGLNSVEITQKLRDVQFEIDRVATLLGSKVPAAGKKASDGLKTELADINNQIADLEQQIELNIKVSGGAPSESLTQMTQVLENLKKKAKEVQAELDNFGKKIPDAIDTAAAAFKKAIQNTKDLGKAIGGLEGKDIPIELHAKVDSLRQIRENLVKAVEDAKIPDKKIAALIDLADFDKEVKKIPDPAVQRTIGLKLDPKDAIAEAKKFVDGLKALGDQPIPVQFETEADSLIKIKEDLLKAVAEAQTPTKKIQAVADLDTFLTSLREIPDPVLKRKILGTLELSDKEAREHLESFLLEAKAKKIGIDLDIIAPDISSKLKILEEKIARFTKNNIPVPIELLILRDQYNADLKQILEQKSETSVDLKLKFKQATLEAEIARLRVVLQTSQEGQPFEVSVGVQARIDQLTTQLAKAKAEEEQKPPVVVPVDVDTEEAKRKLEELRKTAEAIGNVAHGLGKTVGEIASLGDLQKTVDQFKTDAIAAIKGGDQGQISDLFKSGKQFLNDTQSTNPSNINQQLVQILNSLSALAAGGLGGGGTDALKQAVIEAQQKQREDAQQQSQKLQDALAQVKDQIKSDGEALRQALFDLRNPSQLEKDANERSQKEQRVFELQQSIASLQEQANALLREGNGLTIGLSQTISRGNYSKSVTTGAR